MKLWLVFAVTATPVRVGAETGSEYYKPVCALLAASSANMTDDEGARQVVSGSHKHYAALGSFDPHYRQTKHGHADCSSGCQWINYIAGSSVQMPMSTGYVLL